MREIWEEKKKIFIALGIVFAVFLILSIVMKIVPKEENHKRIKENEYVYTLKTSKGENDKVSMLPVINLDFDEIDTYNNDIKKFYYEMIKDERNYFTYKFTVNKNILFILLRTDFFAEDNNSMDTRFMSFNIDLETGELMQNDEVLSKYGYTDENVEKTMLNSMKKYYQEGKQKKYIDPNECNFSCYLIHRDINEKNLLGGVSLYVEDKILVIYRGFTLETVLSDQLQFKGEDFMFEIQK